MLASKSPMFIAWGPELGFLYNDVYAEILADKPPAALERFCEVRPACVDQQLYQHSLISASVPRRDDPTLAVQGSIGGAHVLTTM